MLQPPLLYKCDIKFHSNQKKVTKHWTRIWQGYYLPPFNINCRPGTSTCKQKAFKGNHIQSLINHTYKNKIVLNSIWRTEGTQFHLNTRIHIENAISWHTSTTTKKWQQWVPVTSITEHSVFLRRGEGGGGRFCNTKDLLKCMPPHCVCHSHSAYSEKHTCTSPHIETKLTPKAQTSLQKSSQIHHNVW